jgi:hypothetical protein
VKLSPVISWALFLLICAGVAQAQGSMGYIVPHQREIPALRPAFYHSRDFWLRFSVQESSALVDYSASQHGFRAGQYEQNPIFGSKRPSFARMTAIGTPIEFGYAFLGWRMEQSRSRLIRRASWVPTALSAGEHIGLAIHDDGYAIPNRSNPGRPHIGNGPHVSLALHF